MKGSSLRKIGRDCLAHGTNPKSNADFILLQLTILFGNWRLTILDIYALRTIGSEFTNALVMNKVKFKNKRSVFK